MTLQHGSTLQPDPLHYDAALKGQFDADGGEMLPLAGARWMERTGGYAARGWPAGGLTAQQVKAQVSLWRREAKHSHAEDESESESDDEESCE